MRYLSVCSGIESATVAWHPLGWSAVAYSEIEPFPSVVLAQHYPHTPNWGDMTRFKDWPDAAIDLLVGGTPCQSFSVAGLRKGLDDPRGSLLLTYLAIARRYRPDWLVWENVPGVLSADGGRAFGSLLGGLAELGYGFAYRVLDAQYFGLAQRRQRVFVVGHLGDWRRAAAVLFERESLSGHPAPRREAGEGTPASVARGVALRGRDDGGMIELGDDVAFALRASQGGGDKPHAMIPNTPPISLCLNAGGMGRIDAESETLIPIGGSFDVAHSLRADGFDASEDGTGCGTPLIPIDMRQASRGEKLTNNRAHGSGGAPGVGVSEPGDPAFTVTDRVQAVAFHENQRAELTTNDTAGSLKVGGGKPGQGYPAVQSGMQVRRLTPVECERLQGFPDHYTAVTYRGKPAADGPRYKALGNSMAVSVMAWIGQRIALVESLS